MKYFTYICISRIENMEYKDLIKTIKKYEGSYIEFIMDLSHNNKWFLMTIKEELFKMNYKIIILNNIFSFYELQKITKNIEEKTIIFVNNKIDNNNFKDPYRYFNENCTIIFLCEYYKHKNNNSVNNILSDFNNIRLTYSAGLIVSVISDKVKIEKSRIERIDCDSYFYTYTTIRKLKLKIINYKIENNII